MSDGYQGSDRSVLARPVGPGANSVASHRFDNDLRYRDGEHPNQTALTPEYVLVPVRKLLGGLDLDPCTTDDNPTAARIWYTAREDGLRMPWAGRVFVNPPYGRAREPWVDRCIAHTGPTALLIPAHTDTRAWQKAARSADGVVFIKGRLKFGVLRPNRRQVAASHPSSLFFWNAVDPTACDGLGVVAVLPLALPVVVDPTREDRK